MVTHILDAFKSGGSLAYGCGSESSRNDLGGRRPRADIRIVCTFSKVAALAENRSSRLIGLCWRWRQSG